MRKVLCFEDVLIVPKHWEGGSRSEVDLSTSICGIELDIPIVSANMASLTEVPMAITLAKKGGLGILHRMCSIDEQVQMVRDVKKENLKVGASIGIDENAISNAEKLMDASVDLICLDVAFFAQDNAWNVALDFIRMTEGKFPFIVGNIGTANHVKSFESFLRSKGFNPADLKLAMKPSIGSSGVCSTRVVSQAGMPTFQAVLDISSTPHQCDIIADGGHQTSGHICLSLAAGANCTMIGGMLAATSDSPGEIIEKDGKLYKKYFGNASSEAKTKAGMKNSNIEGVSTLLPYKGETSDVLDAILDGVRSGFTYNGAKNLKEMRENAEFVEITTSGHKESTPYFQNKHI